MITYKDIKKYTFLDAAVTFSFLEMGIYVVNAGGACVGNLPTINSSQHFKSPKKYWVGYLGSGTLTLTPGGGELFNMNGTTKSTIVMRNGDFGYICDDGTYWKISRTNEGGTYTPTLTNNTNVSSSAVGVAQYAQQGDVVTFGVSGSLTPTASGTECKLYITLPVATASGSYSANQIIGVAAYQDSTGAYFPAMIKYINTTTIALSFISTSASPLSGNFALNLQYLLR